MSHAARTTLPWVRPVSLRVLLVLKMLTCPSRVPRVVSSEGPMFTAARYEAAVPENAAKGTPVVRVEAASPSGEPIMYTIVAGNTEELFGLDYSTGGGTMAGSSKAFSGSGSPCPEHTSISDDTCLVDLRVTPPLKSY